MTTRDGYEGKRAVPGYANRLLKKGAPLTTTNPALKQEKQYPLTAVGGSTAMAKDGEC